MYAYLIKLANTCMDYHIFMVAKDKQTKNNDFFSKEEHDF